MFVLGKHCPEKVLKTLSAPSRPDLPISRKGNCRCASLCIWTIDSLGYLSLMSIPSTLSGTCQKDFDEVVLMLSADCGQERASLIEIEAGPWQINAVTFTTNGEYLVSGGSEGVCVWRVQDGRQVTTMTAPIVNCLAVSKDGRWIAAGTIFGDVFVWDAETYEQVFAKGREDFDAREDTNGVDFSPDSTRLRVVVASGNCTASIWDITAPERTSTLEHDDRVIAAKYSPQGDRIATATHHSVRVWDSDDSQLLLDIPAQVAPFHNSGLLWSNNHIFVISHSKIKRIDASTGSAVSEWPVPGADLYSCIAHAQRGKFIAYSTRHAVTFWDTSTRTKLGLIQHLKDIYSIAQSPDDQSLAIASKHRKIIIKPIAHIIDSVSFV